MAQARQADLWGSGPATSSLATLSAAGASVQPFPFRRSGEPVLQRQLRAGEQPQELPGLAVRALRGGRARPQQVRGQQPGEVLRLQRRLQVPWWARRVGPVGGPGAGTEAGTLLPTLTMASVWQVPS